MQDNPLARLCELGQSVWYDYIRRDLMESGTLLRYIAQDRLRGMTSNPTIFQQAIAKSNLYDADIRAAGARLEVPSLFEKIAVTEIQNAADRFRQVYEQTGGRDGHVSLEVAPTLARDTQATIAEARRLWRACARENVMIKIPGTKEGLPAVAACLEEGINVNVTLLFAEARYREVMEVWLGALERRVARGLPVDRVTSVASFFVSRVDSAVDQAIDQKCSALSAADAARLRACRSRLAIANARLAYRAWEEVVRDGKRFRQLAARGAQAQRPLWASTSSKDPALPDVYYVEALIAPHTVNTMPPQTYDAYRNHGVPEVRIAAGLDEARQCFRTIERFGIDFARVTDFLEEDGVKKFAESYRALLQAIQLKREAIS